MRGILPAIVTPLDSGERLLTSSFERLIERCYEAGVDGLYVCGNTGEGLVLDPAVREATVETAMACSAGTRKQVIVHVGAHTQRDAIRLTRHASKLGVTAVSSLPPGGGYGFAETKAYYQALAAVSDVPLLVYHFPAIASFSLAQLEELCGIPGVAGLKFTSFDLYSLRQLRASGRVVFNGHDEVLAAGLLMGADGGIGSTYNVMPELFVALWRHAQQGDWNAAIAVQDQINAVIRVLLDYPLLPAIKQVLTWSGIPCGDAVAPRARLTSEQADSLRERLPRH